MEKLITYLDIKDNEEIQTYIKQADFVLNKMGYTEHSLAHVTKCVKTVEDILTAYGSDKREIELGKIAAYMHDIGNSINRNAHAHSGAIMAFTILREIGMGAKEVSRICSAIGNHDEKTASIVNPIGCSLLLADKMDIRRSRVKGKDKDEFDIHDRVNYAMRSVNSHIDKNKKQITLALDMDTEVAAVIDFFSIYLGRMQLCVEAANFLGFSFNVSINNLVVL